MAGRHDNIRDRAERIRGRKEGRKKWNGRMEKKVRNGKTWNLSKEIKCHLAG